MPAFIRLFSSPLPTLLRLTQIGILIVVSTVEVKADALQQPLDFGLHLTRIKVQLHNGSQSVNTTLKQAGITSFDTRNPLLQPGMYLGYAWLDVPDLASSAGLAPAGFYLGPVLRSALIDGSTLSLDISVAYLYQRVRDSNTTQAATLEWFQPQAKFDLGWHMASQISLRLGGQYSRIDVDEKLSGTVNQALTLQRDASASGHAGLELDLGGSGQAGFLIHRGMNDGVELYFQRQY